MRARPRSIAIASGKGGTGKIKIYCPYCGAENPSRALTCFSCERRIGQYKARNIYLIGIVIWVIIWLVGIFGVGADVFIGFNYWWLLFIPFFACVFGLLVNAIIWWRDRSFGDYPTEVTIIEIVEGHVERLALAISIVLFVAAMMRVLYLSFILYEILALACAFGGVLPLYWIPCDTVKNLVKLRHIKTIPYFYSIFFFIAGLISLAVAIIP